MNAITDTITDTSTLADIVTTHPTLARELEHRNLDYCCGGGTTLADACSANGLDVAIVIDELAAATSDAPSAFASWIANVPTPPEPAWTSTRSPGCTFAAPTRQSHAVNPTSGIDAASSCVRFFGLCASSLSRTAMRSA